MRDLISDINNTSKTNTPRLKNPKEIDIGNTIEYNVKSCQVKKTIMKFIRVQLKKYQRLNARIKRFWYSKHVCYAIR